MRLHQTSSWGDNPDKATVECTDPSGLYDTVQPLLEHRLPLTDLNWKSPSRPLRSIKSLHVELARAKPKALGSSEDGNNAQRRHQIPGLRQTPYVKIYLLRCDDSEAYKTTSRKAVREWVKSVSQSSDEGYNACEHLILHVVLPDTNAAGQPRTSKRSSEGPSDSTDSIPGKSKWPGKSSSTILEKLKADLNSSSKSALDRVAQIRLKTEGASQPNAGTGLSPADLELSWQDLVEKLKLSVLASFDLRVRQYEEDIRERDSQRSLPGWNFCTFFILKEGLARGFEDVGLFQDALVGYEELSYGLDIIVQEQSEGDGIEHGGTLSLFTSDQQQKLKSSQSSPNGIKSNGRHSTKRESQSFSFQLKLHDFVLDPNAKPYRDLILANQISIFDFRVYIFARQLTLLLKAARPSFQNAAAGVEDDFPILAEICNRAMEFIGLGSRTLREDLWHGSAEIKDANSPARTLEPIIDNIVASWVYNICLQILTQTASLALSLPTSGVTGQEEPPQDGIESSPSLRQSLESDRRSDGRPVPLRSSSTRSASSQIRSRSAHRIPVTKTGTEELASARAELFLVARRVLQGLGAKQSWRTDWTDLDVLNATSSPDVSEMEDVSLDGDDDKTGLPVLQNNKEQLDSHSIVNGLEALQLKIAVSNKTEFQSLYEALTDQAYRHFLAGNKVKSAESVVADIALLRYREDDYKTAASLFRRLSSFYESGAWPMLSFTMFTLYAKCLKHMGDIEEYVHLLIKLLTLLTQERRSISLGSSESLRLQYYFDELLENSKHVSRRTSIPFKTLFTVSMLPTSVLHRDGQDGFTLDLHIGCLAGDSITVPDGMSLRLKSSTDLHSPTLILQTDASVTLKERISKVVFKSNVSVTGQYSFDGLSFCIGPIDITHDFWTGDVDSQSGIDLPQESSAAVHTVMVFPAAQALMADIKACRAIKLGDRPQLEVDLETGWNEVQQCTIRIKPATAGLRLHSNETEVLGAEKYGMQIKEDSGAHAVILNNLPKYIKLSLTVPYALEHSENTQLDARLEVTYSTEHGDFKVLHSGFLNSTLPVSVNVQDVFKSNMLLSRFTVGSATLVPLRMLDYQIHDSPDIAVHGGPDGPVSMDISPKQPASLLYRFTPKSANGILGQERSLILVAEYACLDELALSTLETTFWRELKGSDISSLKGLMLPHFLQIFRSHWTAYDLEAISLLKQIHVWPYEDFGWDAVISGLECGNQNRARSWLQSWHIQNQVIPLAEAAIGDEVNRRITINVQLPAPSVVITASLSPIKSLSSSSHIGIGQPLIVELCLSLSRRWALPSVSGNEKVDITYDITSNLDSWLVGGRKRGNVTTKPDRLERFAIMLLPQRPGHLLLPSVEIKCFKHVGSNEESKQAAREEIECEVDYRSHARAILVIPDLKETTTALDGDGVGRNEWLVSSKRYLGLT